MKLKEQLKKIDSDNNEGSSMKNNMDEFLKHNSNIKEIIDKLSKKAYDNC